MRIGGVTDVIADLARDAVQYAAKEISKPKDDKDKKDKDKPADKSAFDRAKDAVHDRMREEAMSQMLTWLVVGWALYSLASKR